MSGSLMSDKSRRPGWSRRRTSVVAAAGWLPWGTVLSRVARLVLGVKLEASQVVFCR